MNFSQAITLIALNSEHMQYILVVFMHAFTNSYKRNCECCVSPFANLEDDLKQAKREHLSLHRLAGDTMQVWRQRFHPITFQNTGIITARLQRPILCQSCDVYCSLLTSNERTLMNLCGYKRGFWAEHKRLHICAQSSLWRVMRITGPLFSPGGVKEPGRGPAAQVSLRMCRTANGKHQWRLCCRPGGLTGRL